MKKIYRIIPLIVCFVAFFFNAIAQTTLNATGSGNTYALINSVLAPGYTAVEASDQATGTHPAFGQHITQVFDATLNKNVFEFYSHLAEDNDVSTGSTDRQRVEIKTYDQSPANLIGTTGETITYKWRFKLPTGFQPSTNFTHIHQIKPVNGDDGDPLFTLTPRKGTPNKLELLYVATSVSGTTTLQTLNLSTIENVWVEATEIVTVSATTTGKYSFRLKRVSDGATLMAYNNAAIATIRADNSFIRPKWGIYRNILIPGDLRDEAVRFSDFSIAEGAAVLAPITYYWVGGTASAAFHGVSTNWNTALDGTGIPRSAAATDDVLIVDGTNLGGTTLTTGTLNGTVTTTNFGQLILKNNAIVILQRITSGTGNIIINGDGTNADDLTIDASSSLKLTSSVASSGLTLTMAAAPAPGPATASINGSISIIDAGVFTTRLYVKTANTFNFLSGSKCFINNTVSSDYPFGQLSTPVAQFGINFKSGSQLIYQGGVNPYTTTATFPFSLEKGSTFIFESTNASNIFDTHTLTNVLVRNNATVTAEAFYNIDTLTVMPGAKFLMKTTGGSPFSGNIVNDGTFGAAVGFTSTNFILDGFVPQSIGGIGTFSDVGTITIGRDANVTLNRNLLIGGTSTSSILGKLNVGTNTIGGSALFQTRTAQTATSNTTTTLGSNTINVDPAVYATGINTANVAAGALVTGAGIQTNTYIIGTNSGASTFIISKPATASSTALGAALTISSNSPTLQTANPGGTDGSITTAGTKTFGSGTNFIFDAATTTPFSVASNIGNLTANANLSFNFPMRVYNTLALNTGVLTTTATNILTLDSAAIVTGADNSKYVNGPAKWRTTFTTPIVFPVGKAGSYRPVTVTPSATTVSQYQAEYFNTGFGDYTISGPLTSVNNTEYWDVQKLSGGNASVGLTLNGVFTGTPNAPTGSDGVVAAHFTGGSWIREGGNYLAPANTVNSGTVTTDMLSSFGPFTFAIAPLTVLPLKLISFTGNRNGANINLAWTTINEINVNSFIVEESIDGIVFLKKGNVNATNNLQTNNYNFAIVNNAVGNSYYRIKMMNSNGSVEYSSIIILKSEKDNTITIYPIPAKNNLNISGLSENTVLKIVNVAGQNVFTQNVNAAALSINVEQLKAGFYFVEIFIKGKKTASKLFIKQ